MEGWIKLHRKLAMNKMWLHDEFTRGQAWVDLLMLANHEDGFIRVRGHRIEIKRGQVGWSQESLAKRWKWSRKKVSNFLQELQEIEQQIEQQKNNFSSIITIVNYGLYQQKEQQNEPLEHSKSTAKAQQKNTNKNDKNVKNNKYSPELPSWIPENTFQEFQLSRKRKIKPESYDRFFKHLKKLCDSSHASPEEILNQSIVNGWEGIFELKTNNTKKGGIMII